MSNTQLFVNRYTSNDTHYSYRHYVNYLKEQWNGIRKEFKNIQCKEFFDLMKKVDFFSSQEHFSCLQFVLEFDAFFEKYPVFYIDPVLFEKFANTKVPSEIKINNVFINKAIFLFPKQNSLNIDFGIVNCTLLKELMGLMSVKDLIDLLSSIVFFKRENRWKHCFSLSQLVVNNKESISEENLYSDLGVNEDELTAINNIIPQIFLYMSLYPDEGITKGTINSNGEGEGFKPSKGGLLTPQMIGLKESQYERSTNPVAHPNMQGISKATHWRRGHWRQLDNGKVTWVRPCLINPEQ